MIERVKAYSRGKVRWNQLFCTKCDNDLDFLDSSCTAYFPNRPQISCFEVIRFENEKPKTVTEIKGNIICSCNTYAVEDVIKITRSFQKIHDEFSSYVNLTHLTLHAARVEMLNLPATLTHLSLTFMGCIKIYGNFQLKSLFERRCQDVEYMDPTTNFGNIVMFTVKQQAYADHVKYMNNLEKLVLDTFYPVSCPIPPKLKHLDIRQVGFDPWESVIDYVRQSSVLETLKLRWKDDEALEMVLESCSVCKSLTSHPTAVDDEWLALQE